MVITKYNKGMIGVEPPSFALAARLWLKIGLLSFGGPAGQIALMHRLLVDERRWIGEGRFMHALNFCMMLPGPEAQQLATYMGWRLHGVWGGVVAGGLFVLPGAAVVLALSILYVYVGALPLVAAVFVGVKAAVLAIVVEALLRISKRALRSGFLWAVAALAFVAIFAFGVPFPLIVLGAAAAGLAWQKITGSAREDMPPSADPVPPLRRTLITAVIGAAVWGAPLILLAGLGGPQVFADVAAFFSKLAVVTFGGAYAVLAYMGQEAVSGYGWLSPGEMLDGLGLAETTPGPLILVTEFVGFLATFRDPGGLAPLAAGMLGAGLTLWVTFVPSFLWIFLGAPYVERLYANAALKAALSAVTAAVVGVILNLAVWFGIHVLFTDVATLQWGVFHLTVPQWGSVNWLPLLLTGLSAVLLLRLHWGVVTTLGVSAGLAFLFYFV